MMKETIMNVGYDDDQAEGALPNGSRVIKIRTYDPVEVHPIGSRGIVLGSIAVVQEVDEMVAKGIEPSDFLYFVAWEVAPDMPTICAAEKIRLAQ